MLNLDRTPWHMTCDIVGVRPQRARRKLDGARMSARELRAEPYPTFRRRAPRHECRRKKEIWSTWRSSTFYFFETSLPQSVHSFAHPSARFFRRLQQTLMPPQTKALPIDGASVTTFDRFGDHRGYFNELYNEEKYDGLSAPGERWKQVSFSSSQKHALRGLHCSPHGKFITCVRGSFYDVIADFRDGSPTFGRWCGVLLTDKNKKQECRRR